MQIRAGYNMCIISLTLFPLSLLCKYTSRALALASLDLGNIHAPVLTLLLHQVCYHNLLMDSDYDSLGHTEVVVVKSPADKVADFAAMLIPNLFKNGRRADPQVS